MSKQLALLRKIVWLTIVDKFNAKAIHTHSPMTEPAAQAVPELDCAAFANELRRLRNTRGVAQSDLARKLNIKPPYLCSVERLHRPAPGHAFIDRICAALELKEQEALGLRSAAERARTGWKRWLNLRRDNAKAKPNFPVNLAGVEIFVNGVCFVVPHLPNAQSMGIQIVLRP